MLTADFRVFVANAKAEHSPFVLVTYRRGNIGRYIDETGIILDVYAIDSEQQSHLIKKEKLCQTSLITERYDESESKFRYLKVDDTPKGPPVEEPAEKEEAKVFLADANQDGHTDILVWMTRYVSRRTTDMEEDDFYLASQKFSVMLFDPGTKSFSDLTPMK